MHDHNKAQRCLASRQLVRLTCGPSLKPQTTVDSFSFAVFNSLSILTNHSDKVSKSTFLWLTFEAVVTCVVFFFILLYSYIVVQLHFAFLCIAMFVEFIDKETSKPDLKEPFIVFMINQCVSVSTRGQISLLHWFCFNCLDKWLPINIFLIVSSVTSTAHYLLITYEHVMF